MEQPGMSFNSTMVRLKDDVDVFDLEGLRHVSIPQWFD